MRKLLAAFALLACSAAASAACDWSNPGHDKYTGNYESAMAHYADIPAATRARLVARMNAHDYDEMVTITNDKIVGRGTYEPDIWGMHWGADRMCMQVVRPNLVGPHTALAYTEGSFTVYVPSDCNNVARGTRLLAPPKGGISGIGPVAGDPYGGGGGVPVGGVPPEGRERPMGLVPLLPPVYGYNTPGLYAPVPPEAAPPEVVYVPGPPVYDGYPWGPGGPIGSIVVVRVPPIVAAVPEPATWAMWFAGLASMLLVATRQRRRLARA